MNRHVTGGLKRGHEKEPRRKELISGAADRADFKEVIPGVSRAVLWGNPDRGAYGAFTKFVPGLDAGTHMHTHDVWIVVLQGAYLYRDAAGERRVGAREFLRIPGGLKHWSGGDSNDGALFYEESSGKFDLLTVN